MIDLNTLAPALQLPNLDAELVTVLPQPGRIVVINFWSAVCGWSERIDPDLIAAAHLWGKSVQVYWVAAEAAETADQLRKGAQERGLPNVLLDRQRTAIDLLGAKTTPHCFVFDRDTRLVYRGAFDDRTFRKRSATRNYLLETISTLLAGQPVAPFETTPYGCAITPHLS